MSATPKLFILVGVLLSPICNAFSPLTDISRPQSHTHLWKCNEVIATKKKTIKKSLTQVNLVPASPAAAGVAAIAGVISGGVVSGGLHAVAGPDHLAALVPKCCGLKWYKAVRIGAVWGIGHSISATLLGMAAFFLKNNLNHFKVGGAFRNLSSFTEGAVGLSLLLIGFMGIRESLEWKSDIETIGSPQSLSAAVPDSRVTIDTRNRAVLFNGLLHGFSWDGAPSLAPALAVATWTANLTFLLSYSIGTTCAMALATTVIGEGSRRAASMLDRPDIPQKLSFVSSWAAILIGAFWMRLAAISLR